MTRLTAMFAALREREEKAMGLFITNGYPNPDVTVDLLHTLVSNGADFIELGMPFSDPLAEGIPIQRSSEVALNWGVRMPDAFDVVRTFRETSETPVLLMGYINPVFRYGIGNFCRDARSAGVDGLILPDLPPHEAGIIRKEAEEQGLALVNLVAPNSSDERVVSIDQLTNGFVYAVSVTGLTGSSIADESVDRYLSRIRPLVRKNPLLVGFGIRTHEQAMALCAHTDGFIVGSAVIREIESLWNDEKLDEQERLQKLGRFVHTLKFGV